MRFGAHKYTTKYISDHYFYWKDKDKSELLSIVNECISFNQQLDLKPATNKDTPIASTKSYISEMNNLKITDGFLDNLLAQNNCLSLIDLVEKTKLK